jgi:hypothetical protein
MKPPKMQKNLIVDTIRFINVEEEINICLSSSHFIVAERMKVFHMVGGSSPS